MDATGHGWITEADQSPDDGATVLVWLGTSASVLYPGRTGVGVARYHTSGGLAGAPWWQGGNGMGMQPEPQFWCPCPEPPVGVSE